MHKTIIAAVLTSVLIPGYAVALEDIHTGTVIVGSVFQVSLLRSCSKSTNKMS